MMRIFIIAVCALMLASCAPDPRRDASAFATRQQAETQAEAARQELAQDAEAHALFMARVQEVSAWISTLMMTVIIATMFFAMVALTSTGIGVSLVTISAGIATAQRNLSMPNQIRLDPVTRQYPLLITKIKDGQYTLSNPNTDSVTMLYERNPADMMMIQAMGATQHAGALAHEARMSHRPGEVAAITGPQIIEMERTQ